jgi:alkanesulfonate monooxygenase SsuD/methylene tetrahydromethanopterin reductase-like flavin-dependent oxidoreductase (luciferase family)
VHREQDDLVNALVLEAADQVEIGTAAVGCDQNPKPVQKPHPPIYAGGESDAALSRAARLCQGWYGVGLTPETLPERLEVLDVKLTDNDRTRKDIAVLVAPYGGKPDLDLIRRFQDQGVDEVVLFAMHSKRERVYQMIDDLAERIVAKAA